MSLAIRLGLELSPDATNEQLVVFEVDQQGAALRDLEHRFVKLVERIVQLEAEVAELRKAASATASS